MAKKIAVTMIEDARKALGELAKATRAPKEVGVRDAIRSLAKEIGALQTKGYAVQEIADHLGKVGIEVNAASLRAYIRSEVKNGKAEKKEIVSRTSGSAKT